MFFAATATRRGLRIGFALAATVMALPFALMLLWVFVEPVSTLMLGRWATGQPVVRQWRPIGAIDRRLIVAVLASEDNGFCRHHGVDWDELREVVADAHGPRRGGSTITMQLTKNLFLWNGRSYVRKAIEIPLALVLDLVWSKPRILEAYLNIAEWGPNGEFGVEAGALQAFGKGAGRLSPTEAALLAVTLPNPHRRRPAHPTNGMRRVAGIAAARAAASPELADCIAMGSAEAEEPPARTTEAPDRRLKRRRD